MAEAPKPEPSKRWRHRFVLAASVAAMAGGVVVALGPGAPWIVDHLADGQRVWRLGRVHIDGVTGSWLGALHAAHLSIADDDGVWLDAHDVVLDWTPQDLAFGALHLNQVHAGALTISRQPALSEAAPAGGGEMDVHIGALRIDAIDLAAPAFGQAARFNATLALDVKGDALQTLDLNIQRLDSDADHVVAFYRPGRDYGLRVDVLGRAGGIISDIIGAPNRAFTAAANAHGSDQAGNAHYEAALGDSQLLNGDAHWGPQQWSINAQARLNALPVFAALAERIGPTISLQGRGARVGAFTLHAETPFFALDLAGAQNSDHVLQGSTHFVATTTRLSDIARESPFELGAARLEGEMRQARGTTAFRATLTDAAAEAFGQRATFSGPVQGAFTGAGFRIAGEIQAGANAPPLFARGRLITDLAFDNQRGRFTLTRAQFESDAAAIDARGWFNNGDGEFAGAWTARQLGALFGDLRGGGAGQWRAHAALERGAHIWTTTVRGVGADITGAPAIIPQLLGRAPRFDAMLRNENGGITVSHARIDGDRLRAGATGRIVGGQANLELEASARGPLDLGGATINGAADATGRLTGRIAQPVLSARATLSSFAANQVVVARPIVEFTLAPGVHGYAGHATVQGTVSGQALAGVSDVAIASDGLRLTNLDAHAGALEARGDAILAPHGASANLAVSGELDGLMEGVSGRVTGNAHLTPQNVAIDAQLADARAGELRLRAANITAQGPYNAIAAHVDLRGRLHDAPLSFRGNAAINAGHGVVDALIDGSGLLSDATIATREPLHMRWSDQGLQAALNISIADGGIIAAWSERERALSGSAHVQDAPLAPLAAIWGEHATGRIDGRVVLQNDGGGLSGTTDITLADARFAGRQRGTLNMHIAGNLDPARVAAQIDATSSDGLTAHFEANAPVVTAASPLRVALAPERRGQASWSVHGPAASLWAAARLQDQSLDGQLNGEGTLQFGAGYLAGSGHIEIADGRFEDKLSGVSLVNLNARVDIDQRGVTIDHFNADGPHGGHLTATGGSANPNEGRIAVTLQDMRVADRPDAHARANGDLTLTWQGLHSSLSGDLNILDADLDIASSPEAGIPTLNVVEINRPGDDDDLPPDQAPHPATITDLNVHVRAPGRVVTRGRGVDAEWSLDMQLTGTSSNPRIVGEARSVRGTLALSGQPFDITDATITFDGDPLDARIDLTAERDTADLTATIRLTGTARNPEIALSSTPALPEDEILPQVLFGHSVEDLSAFEAAQLAASLAALSGRASLDLVDAARAAAGLDRFNIQQDPSGGFLVSGGVYLTRGVYVEVARTGLGQAQTRVEWTIRPRLVLITSFLGNGDQRVSLRWRRESN